MANSSLFAILNQAAELLATPFESRSSGSGIILSSSKAFGRIVMYAVRDDRSLLFQPALEGGHTAEAIHPLLKLNGVKWSKRIFYPMLRDRDAETCAFSDRIGGAPGAIQVADRWLVRLCRLFLG